MKKTLDNFSFGLFLWQTLMFIVLIVIVIAIVKLYKKLMKYLDRK
jgi:F0F1-type ATP synthase membrane subunit b/b'